uniref:translation machinery-associated protein 16 isoform X1 n=2 Tax=Myxine glutinosa TaxID=7769 RepID=UPI00358E021F
MPKAARTVKPKVGAEKVIHPYSRKASQLCRQMHKMQRKERNKTERAVKLGIIGQKLEWFHTHLDPIKTAYSKQEACQLVENYLKRFESELEQIQILAEIGTRQGRPHAAREDAIRHTKQTERELYHGNGLEIPDIINIKHFRMFREWDGDLKQLPNIKMRKVTARDAKEKDKKSKKKMDEDVDADSMVS